MEWINLDACVHVSHPGSEKFTNENLWNDKKDPMIA